MKVLRENLQEETLRGSSFAVAPEELVPRFLSRLQLTSEVEKPVCHFTREFSRFGKVKDQCAIIAVAIFVVVWLLNVEHKPRLGNVATVANVTEAQFKAAYAEIHQHNIA